MARTTASPGTARPVVYPERDGKPMGETPLHVQGMIDIGFACQTHFRARPDVFVAINILVYYEEGNPRRRFSPDVIVLMGTTPRERRSVFLWEEPQPPAVIFEVTSRGSRREDMVRKRPLYAELGVREYWLWDPAGEYLHPALQGYRLVPTDGPGAAARYEPQERLLAEELAYWSDELGLELHLRDGWLRFRDPVTDRWLLTPAEAHEQALAEAAARREAEARAAAEAAARRVAEAELARLRALLDQQQHETP